MLPSTDRFKQGAAETLADPVIQMSMEAVYTGFHSNRQTAAAATPGWDEQRDRGRAIKEHTIANLDYYLEMLADNVEANGGSVFFADDSAAAKYATPSASTEGIIHDWLSESTTKDTTTASVIATSVRIVAELIIGVAVTISWLAVGPGTTARRSWRSV